jgi:uncharacterized membrane protein YdjX (TVP38/TMEM64 family)
MVLLLVWVWQHFGLGALLTLDNLKASRDTLQAQVQAQPLGMAFLFFAVYVVATALSIPGAVILTLAAGALFGLGWGLLLVSFASSLGALLAFLVRLLHKKYLSRNKDSYFPVLPVRIRLQQIQISMLFKISPA